MDSLDRDELPTLRDTIRTVGMVDPTGTISHLPAGDHYARALDDAFANEHTVKVLAFVDTTLPHREPQPESRAAILEAEWIRQTLTLRTVLQAPDLTALDLLAELCGDA